ncbi:MAG: hypothetical protein ABII02_02240 [Candidatus Magasanikbacteria bacterium]
MCYLHGTCKKQTDCRSGIQEDVMCRLSLAAVLVLTLAFGACQSEIISTTSRSEAANAKEDVSAEEAEKGVRDEKDWDKRGLEVCRSLLGKFHRCVSNILEEEVSGFL